jgi:hypothetical protein
MTVAGAVLPRHPVQLYSALVVLLEARNWNIHCRLSA